MQDGNAVPAAEPATDGPDPETRITGRNPLAAFRRPHDVESVAMDAMRGATMPHVPVLPQMSRPFRVKAHLREDRDMVRFR